MKAALVRMRADVARVLERLGLEFEERGDELYALCPNPEHQDEHVGSWSMHSEAGEESNGLAYCHACGWSGDVFDVVEIARGRGFVDAVRFVRKGVGSLEEKGGSREDPAIYWNTLKTWTPEEIELPTDRRIRWKSRCGSYLRGRGYWKEDADWAGAVDWREKGRVVVPLYHEGRIVSWVARSYAGREPKVLTPKGCRGTRWGIFGSDKFDKSLGVINLAEGWLDAMRMRQAGIQNPAALCTSKLTMEKVEAMKWAHTINVWADGDEAGRAMIADVVGYLWKRGRTIGVAVMPEGEDPDDQSPEFLANTNPVAWRDHRRTGE